MEENLESSAKTFRDKLKSELKDIFNTACISDEQWDLTSKQMHASTLCFKKQVIEMAGRVASHREGLALLIDKTSKAQMYDRAHVDKITFECVDDGVVFGICIADYRDEMEEAMEELRSAIPQQEGHKFVKWCNEFLDTILANAFRNMDICSRVVPVPPHVVEQKTIPLPERYYDSRVPLDQKPLYQATYDKMLVDNRRGQVKMCRLM